MDGQDLPRTASTVVAEDNNILCTIDGNTAALILQHAVGARVIFEKPGVWVITGPDLWDAYQRTHTFMNEAGQG